MNIFKKLKAHLRYREAVKQAEKAHSETGERYYVMPAFGDAKKSLLIMDRRSFRKFKQKGYVASRANVGDLELECFYCTAYRNGDAKLSEDYLAVKKRQYYAWFDGKVQR